MYSMEEIFNYLLQHGWQRDEDTFTKTIQVRRNSQLIVNGQAVQQPPQNVKFTINYEGQGFVDNDPIYGFSVSENAENQSDLVYISDLEDFIDVFKKIL